MANELITPNIIAREALFMAVNMMVMGAIVNRRYSGEFNEVGDTIRVRKPVKFKTVDGPDITALIQDVKESSVDVTIDTNPIVPFNFEDKDMALTIGEFRERYIVPAANAIANRVDRALCSKALGIPNVVGIAGTTPDDFDAVAAAAEVLDRNSTPRDGLRSFVIDPRANRMLASSFQAGFNPQGQQSDTFRNGLVKNASGFDIFMDQNVVAYQDDALTNPIVVNGAGQTGDTLNVTFGTPLESINEGAVIQLADVNGVNPISFEDTGFPAQFVVLENVTSAAVTGDAALPIYPEIHDATDGVLQTVTALAANGAAVTLQTAGPVVATPEFSRQNIAFHRDCFGIVSANLRLPKGMDMAEVVSYKGYTMRFVRGFELKTGKWISRLEMLFGTAFYHRDMGVRVLG
jgi:hypothetical protein